MLTKEIRAKFLEFFRKNQHTIISSSPLVPHNDPTLMFTNAGMVQFKDYFTGAQPSITPRAASSQKCVRAGGKHNDLDNVGYTARHHTFFEMLGNFSFGDYFKETAIDLAWRFLTQELGIDRHKLYVTVYHTDDEAYNLWQKIAGLGADKIIRIASDDNFWAMGDTGPCGPCSEIFYDHGEKYAGGLPGTPDADGDRFVEIWNLVFMQYEQLPNGERIALPQASIDTGMGLERVAAVLQGTNHNYETDIFQKLIQASKQLSGCSDHLTSHRVVADHLRASCFLIADGIMPSNDGRGYVLRRIMRRAIRHIQQMGCHDVLMYKLVPTLVAEMGDVYPELQRAEALLKSVLQQEEERFRQTLDKGLRLLEQDIATLKQAGNKILPGDKAFKLYDTYGFPVDLTKDILKAQAIAVDEEGFAASMQEQKIKARAAWAGSGEQAVDKLWLTLQQEHGNTEFLGYQTITAEAQVVALVANGAVVNEAQPGMQVVAILNQTPFYAESGGQVGDTGLLGKHRVLDTKKYAQGLHGHILELTAPLKVGEKMVAQVDQQRRLAIKANHSATHLLHHALQQLLGASVVQKGSIVTHEKLRFDFSQPQALTNAQLQEIEAKVNSMIIANEAVNMRLMASEAAIAEGAMALFGEKYGDEVRVISMGKSLELCGGTHVSRTGDIGMFKIISEEAIAAGVRRIEAATGLVALNYTQNKANCLAAAAEILKTNAESVPERLSALLAERKDLEKALAQKNMQLALSQANKPEQGILCCQLEGIAPKDLKNIAEELEKKHAAEVTVLASVYEGRVSLLIKVANHIAEHYSAKELMQAAVLSIDGKGGGNDKLAQAGGANIDGITAAFAVVRNLIER